MRFWAFNAGLIFRPPDTLNQGASPDGRFRLFLTSPTGGNEFPSPATAEANSECLDMPEPPLTSDAVLALESAGLELPTTTCSPASSPNSGQVPPTASIPPRALIQAGILTPFQARLILQGKHRGFKLGPYRVLDQIRCRRNGAGVSCRTRRGFRFAGWPSRYFRPSRRARPHAMWSGSTRKPAPAAARPPTNIGPRLRRLTRATRARTFWCWSR